MIPFFRKRFPEKRIVFHMHNVYEYLGRLEKPNGDFEIQTDLTLACSRFLLDREKNRLGQGAKRLDVIYNGVEPEVFRPSWDNPAEADGLRRQYGLEGKKVVLYTGKIRESKGVMVLFSAMKQVFLKDPTIHLVLAGGTGFGYKRTDKATDFSERLQKEIRAFPDRVTFIRFTQPRNMPRIYLLGDIFAAPSQLEEALGMVFLEASACGLPVIGTSQGGIPEVIRDQETGLLLREKDNVEELSDKILFLLRNPDLARRMGEKGRQLMMNYFSWDKIAQRLESSYDDLLAQ
jgi:spore coat protein SA